MWLLLILPLVVPPLSQKCMLICLENIRAPLFFYSRTLNNLLGAPAFVYLLATHAVVATVVTRLIKTLRALVVEVWLVVYSNFVLKLQLSMFLLVVFSITIAQKVWTFPYRIHKIFLIGLSENNEWHYHQWALPL